MSPFVQRVAGKPAIFAYHEGGYRMSNTGGINEKHPDMKRMTKWIGGGRIRTVYYDRGFNIVGYETLYGDVWLKEPGFWTKVARLFGGRR